MSQYLYAFMSSLGFGILFNVRGKDLFFASLGGGMELVGLSILKF